MDIAKMRQILAIRDHGSFAKAAEAIGMAQPSLSKSISRLEDQLRVRLFDRTATGSELTAVGQLIAERAARVIAEADNIVRDAELIAGGESGRVRIGIGNGLLGEFITRLTLSVVEHHPNLGLHVDVSYWTILLEALAARELDVVFCALAPQAQDPRFVVTDILNAAVVAVAAPGHPLARMETIEVDEFARHRSAGPPGEFAVAGVVGAEHNENLSFYTTSSFDAVIPIVVAGKATMVAPHFVVRRLIDSGALVALNLDLGFDISFVAVTTRAANYSPILNKIIREARHIGQLLQADWEIEAGSPRSAPPPPPSRRPAAQE